VRLLRQTPRIAARLGRGFSCPQMEEDEEAAGVGGGGGGRGVNITVSHSWFKGLPCSNSALISQWSEAMACCNERGKQNKKRPEI